MDDPFVLGAQLDMMRTSEESPLRFYCRFVSDVDDRLRTIQLSPHVMPSAEGFCIEGITIPAHALIYPSRDLQTIKEFHKQWEPILQAYYEVASFGIMEYPIPAHILDAVAELPLTNEERQKVEAERAQFTYIYLVKDERTGYHKIGRSNNPKARLQQLIKQDTLLPEANLFSLIDCWESRPYLEYALHEQFTAKRIRGEWFDLDKEDLSELRERFYHDKSFITGKTQDEIYEEDYAEYLASGGIQ